MKRTAITIVEGYIAIVAPVIEQIGRAIAWLIPAMMLLISAVVGLRYGLQQGSVLLQEAVLYLHATVLMLGFAYALKHNAHVRVDVFYSRWSKRRRAIVDLIGHGLFLAPVALIIGLGSLDYVSASWAIQEKSPEAGGIPAIFLLKSLLPLCAVLLLLQGLASACEAALVLLQDRQTSR